MSTKAPNVSFHPDYFASWSRLDPVDMKRLNEALLKFQADPGHPGLNLEQLDGSLSDLMSIRAGRDIRVILYREGDTYIWGTTDGAVGHEALSHGSCGAMPARSR